MSIWVSLISKSWSFWRPKLLVKNDASIEICQDWNENIFGKWHTRDTDIAALLGAPLVPAKRWKLFFFYISVLNKYNSTLRSFRMLEMTHDSGYNRNPGLFLALHDNLIIWKTKQKLSKYFTPFPQLVTPLAEDLACWWSSFGWLQLRIPSWTSKLGKTDFF